MPHKAMLAAMSDSALDRLALAYGVLPAYLAMDGEWEAVSDGAKSCVLAAMGVPADTPSAIASSLESAPTPPDTALHAAKGMRCFLPEWLKAGRGWGLTCQLYGVRSARNHGIGDFEDLARLAEIAGSTGADFLGVNPLHALFLAEPLRCSPFSPSNRNFLNPLYIVLDAIPGYRGTVHIDPDAVANARAGDHVDYATVAALKRGVFERVWKALHEAPDLWAPDAQKRFVAFREERGEALRAHALFEALSEAMVREGHGCGWHGWPAAYRAIHGDAVATFARSNPERIAFHSWLQWVADEQLKRVQERALAAGMRIGLYLDLAVGVASDGSATWADPALSVPSVRVGAPPDNFNDAGQDWGLAPLSPAALRDRDLAPFRSILADTMRHAGALRIDHAMSLYRLFWIPEGFSARDGAYVVYPLAEMLAALREASWTHRAAIVGEDLGVVPPGFRELMEDAAILSYRVLYFEREGEAFRPPADYPVGAFACVSTHDLSPLKGWWLGDDIGLRRDLGHITDDEAESQRLERQRDRQALLAALAEAGLYEPEPVGTAVERGEAAPDGLVAALHAHVARAPSRLFAVQIEDLAGAVAPVNVPGTMAEYRNWQRRIPLDLEDLPGTALFGATITAIASERPRP